jgi:septal ring factor EnvC (AmiA/AmiB activator)
MENSHSESAEKLYFKALKESIPLRKAHQLQADSSSRVAPYCRNMAPASTSMLEVFNHDLTKLDYARADVDQFSHETKERLKDRADIAL